MKVSAKFLWVLSLLIIGCTNQIDENVSKKTNSLSKNGEDANDRLDLINVDIDKYKNKWFFLKYWDHMTEQEFKFVSKKLEEAGEIRLLQNEQFNLNETFFTIYTKTDSVVLDIEPSFNDDGFLTKITLIAKAQEINNIEYELKEAKYKSVTEMYKTKYGKPKFKKDDLGLFGYNNRYVWMPKNKKIEIIESYRYLKNPVYEDEKLGFTIYQIYYYGESVVKESIQKKKNLERKSGKSLEKI